MMFRTLARALPAVRSAVPRFATATRTVARKTPFRAAGAFAVAATATVFATIPTVAADDSVDYDAVRREIASILDAEGFDDGSLGPILVRLAWHSSGTYDVSDGSGGSSGATMRFNPEAGHGANAGLAIARDIMEVIKKKFPGISYADLYTLAGAVAIEEMGGPRVPWRPGRTDAPDGRSCTPDGRLPDAALGAQHLRDIFYRMGFDDKDIVALSGAHALGRCHTDRSGFSGPWTRAPTTFSNEYFRELLDNKWTEKRWGGPRQFEDPTGDLMMLPTDLSIRDDPSFRKYAEQYKNDEAAFFNDFASAFGKMMELGVKFPESENTTPRVLIGTLAVMALAGGAKLPFPFK